MHTCWLPPHVTKINQTQMQQGYIPKEGLHHSFYPAYPFLIATKYYQKFI